MIVSVCLAPVCPFIMAISDQPESQSSSNKTSPGGSPKARGCAAGVTLEDLPSSPSSSPDQSSSPHGLLQGDAHIEAGGSDSDGEFLANEYDAASVSSESGASSTESASLSSSIYEHSYENGRRYHRYRHGRYPIPNDETEQNRENMLHAMMLEATDGRYFYAPIDDHPQKIADLGTGTGLWAIESTS